MQNLAENLWTVGKTVTTSAIGHGFSIVQTGVNTIQTWGEDQDPDDGRVSPDKEIHKILMMYGPNELDAKAEKYLMNLRTEILDISAKYEDDIRVQLYINRNSHTFGAGRHCIVINITDSNIDMKIYSSSTTKRLSNSISVSKFASGTKSVLKSVRAFNFL